MIFQCSDQLIWGDTLFQSILTDIVSFYVSCIVLIITCIVLRLVNLHLFSVPAAFAPTQLVYCAWPLLATVILPAKEKWNEIFQPLSLKRHSSCKMQSRRHTPASCLRCNIALAAWKQLLGHFGNKSNPGKTRTLRLFSLRTATGIPKLHSSCSQFRHSAGFLCQRGQRSAAIKSCCRFGFGCGNGWLKTTCTAGAEAARWPLSCCALKGSARGPQAVARVWPLTSDQHVAKVKGNAYWMTAIAILLSRTFARTRGVDLEALGHQLWTLRSNLVLSMVSYL